MAKQWWVFTFGVGTINKHKYVKIYGTCDDTRSAMFERYGREWSSQYPEEQFKLTSMADTYECLNEINLYKEDK